MKFFILALFLALDCGAAFAQTTAPAPSGTQIFEGTPVFVDSKPRPTFFFRVAPRFRGFLSLTLTWGTGSTKDGIAIKHSPLLGTSVITDIRKIGDVVTPDSRNDIYGAVYNTAQQLPFNDGKLSFIRDWDTGDSREDVAFKMNGANSFQWEVVFPQGVFPQTRYVGSNSFTFLQSAALLESQGLDSLVGFSGLENQNLFSSGMVLTVSPTKPRVENFAENFQFQ